MNRLRDALAYCLGLLRGSGDDAGHDEEAEQPADALHGAGDVRWEQQRKHFWAEFHEGQRQAEERARAPH